MEQPATWVYVKFPIGSETFTVAIPVPFPDPSQDVMDQAVETAVTQFREMCISAEQRKTVEVVDTSPSTVQDEDDS